MKIAIINVPFETPWVGKDTWIKVPPDGYGGVQWVVANLIDGLLELGHEIFLLGAPGSSSANQSLRIIDRGAPAAMWDWLVENEVDIIHDCSNGLVDLDQGSLKCPYISTYHMTGRPRNPTNTVYLSHAQMRGARADRAPVIRIPVNPARYEFQSEKRSDLLFLGRISPWKGAYEASAFAVAAGRRLVLAGPTWEQDYLSSIREKFGDQVIIMGEVGGKVRRTLLAEATALLAFSQPVDGPWGDVWSEPGATVVSEAAVSGTPVISSENGCLAEITPQVGRVLPCGEKVSSARARAVLDSLPSAEAVRDVAIREWGHLRIAGQYESLYRTVIAGKRWR